MKPRNRITKSIGWATVPDTNHSEMEFLTTIGDKDIYLRPSVHSHGRSEFFVVGEDETPRYLETISSWAVSGAALSVLEDRASLTKEISAFLRFYALITQ